MKPPEILWSVGAVLVLVGELWAVATRERGDTITEHVLQNPVYLATMGALIVWAGWHFFFAQGKARVVDLAVVVAGLIVGALVWLANAKRPRQDERDDG